MKKIDTKSLVLGAVLTVVLLTLTSGKTFSDNNDLEIFEHDRNLDVFNKQTNTVYEYYLRAKGVSEKPDKIYKIAPDGSSITIEK